MVGHGKLSLHTLIIKFVFTLLVAYLVVLVSMYLGQRRLTFPSSHYAPSLAEVNAPHFSQVEMTTADGIQLAAWYAPPRDPALPVIVHYHGNGSYLGSRLFATEGQIAEGYGVLLTSYRGYSHNAGVPSEEGLYMDARATLDWLKGQGITNIVLQGESLGTGVAIQMAAERKVSALILEAPYTSLPDVAATHYPFLPVRWLMKENFNSLQKVGLIKDTPLMILTGERDQVVPAIHGHQIFDAANNPKVALWLPEADHFSLYQFGAGPAIMQFLDSLFKAKPAAKPE